MRGRTPIHAGNGHSEGQKSGEETHTLSMGEMPQHKHVVSASHDNATSTSPAGRSLARARENTYSAYDPGNAVDMASSFLTHAGGGQAHENMQPYSTVNFCIAIQGLFPSRN
jgi:microcystin-dependent protein